ncbi:HNH endonuclease signature motif containing protein [Paraclostridium benzoelyticum]|uniref:HNH endonuclease signature motif containing protein n=1 Tax=Paraclostridium benzoelyticum TaxID=1629550 RepID=UPI003D6964E0
MTEIQFKLLCTMKNRLQNCSSTNGIKSETFNKFYKGYNFKTYFVDNIALFPIGGIKHRNPMMFTQTINPYTEEGRNMIHKNLIYVSPSDLQYIINNPVKDMSAEYNDNRVSLFSAQMGTCFITSEPLSPMDMECHHIKPRKLGGSDDWKNLMLITPSVHKVIHATEEGTISKYLGNIYFSDEKHKISCLKKINKYRKIVGNDKINYKIN